MMSLLQAAPTDTPPAASASPADARTRSFQAVEGGGEQMASGETLLIQAYVALWVILMLWLGLLWRRQSQMNGRLDALEQEIARAEASRAK
jgi:hypothetical protein